jgi:DNA replication and repair protein RecF
MLTALGLFAFRNYLKQTVPLAPGVNLFLGANAQGKTNLLEAVYFASTGRSPRSSVLAEMVMWEQNGARVVLDFEAGDDTHKVEMRLERDAAGRTRRTARLDGRAVTATSIPGGTRVVLFHPEEMTLIRGGGEPRRRLLNGMLAQSRPGYAELLSRYGRVLEQRNQLLKRIAQELESDASLGVWTAELARLGGELVTARREAMAELAPLVHAKHAGIAGGEDLAVRYAPNVDDESDPAGAIAGELKARLREELARGLTVAGPHRDDITFSLAGLPAASHASQGQQRTAILAFKLAEVDALSQGDQPPVLLLDDVMSELDAERREHLLALVQASPQAMITAAEAGYFPARAGERILSRAVRAGRVEPTHQPDA